MNDKIHHSLPANRSDNKKNSKNPTDDQSIQEIKDLIENPEFIDFAKTLAELIEDSTTFNEILSSQLVLKKALAILRQTENNSKKHHSQDQSI